MNYSSKGLFEEREREWIPPKLIRERIGSCRRVESDEHSRERDGMVWCLGGSLFFASGATGEEKNKRRVLFFYLSCLPHSLSQMRRLSLKAAGVSSRTICLSRNCLYWIPKRNWEKGRRKVMREPDVREKGCNGCCILQHTCVVWVARKNTTYTGYRLYSSCSPPPSSSLPHFSFSVFFSWIYILFPLLSFYLQMEIKIALGSGDIGISAASIFSQFLLSLSEAATYFVSGDESSPREGQLLARTQKNIHFAGRLCEGTERERERGGSPSSLQVTSHWAQRCVYVSGAVINHSCNQSLHERGEKSAVLIPSDLTGIPSFLLFYHLFGCKKETEEEETELVLYCSTMSEHPLATQKTQKDLAFVVPCLIEWMKERREVKWAGLLRYPSSSLFWANNVSFSVFFRLEYIRQNRTEENALQERRLEAKIISLSLHPYPLSLDPILHSFPSAAMFSLHAVTPFLYLLNSFFHGTIPCYFEFLSFCRSVTIIHTYVICVYIWRDVDWRLQRWSRTIFQKVNNRQVLYCLFSFSSSCEK